MHVESFEPLKVYNFPSPYTVVIGNEKGGAGKTTITRYLSYTLARAGYRVLVVDEDPQHDLTDSMFNTRKLWHDDEPKYSKTLMDCITTGSVDGAVINVMHNLDMIPSYKDLKFLPAYLSKLYGVAMPTDEDYYEIELKKRSIIKDLLAPIKANYDFIFIDTPPTSSDWTNSAVYASDYIVIAFQTQLDSLKDARDFVSDDLKTSIEQFNVGTDVLGILPNQFMGQGAVDRIVRDSADDFFGSQNIFKNIFKFVKASQSAPSTGVSLQSYWEREMFNEVVIPMTKEFLDRLHIMEEQ